ncbi:MAG: hypothetical protein CL760_06555 [Chloroflexi bacterium]|nr:hypothetical protein [Chloroflexota bacterium]|tara:strand:- start:16896 stop:17195 length:300 start_codon:yes stop_codon:yes gene_type:complete
MKRVLKANLALRFQVLDGWTRKEVADLLETKNIRAVLPSYFDMEKQNKIIEKKEGFLMPESCNDNDFSDCEYFLVLSKDDPFNQKALEENASIFYPEMH